MALALDASRGGGLVPQARLGNPAAAPFADPVGTFPKALEGPLDLFPVLVQEVHQQVAGLAVGQGLRQVRLLGNPCDHAAGGGEAPGEAEGLGLGLGQGAGVGGTKVMSKVRSRPGGLWLAWERSVYLQVPG